MSSQKWPITFPDRIQLYSLATPNGQKISIALEEFELPYEAHRVDIMAGDQFLDEYKVISPNSKIPAIVDPKGSDGKKLVLMESGAILLYLAEKTGKLLPKGQAKYTHLQWLFFQVGHIGPMFGQFGHFHKYARAKCDHPYPLQRYQTETQRLLAVLEQRLSESEFVGGSDYSIVDISIAPWVDCLGTFYEGTEILQLKNYQRVQAWLTRCKSRPAYERGSQVCR
ncbi:MAG TPA: glutathione S-transferase N-terminal domain-containing protein [Oligoflexus sp.]|uniref:glutathione S-transferase N-terminal domain-containing protein n=1 Tax=Oligoflexus sp. TaxID=1971216 RepID=UPI002D4F2BED|nr:glutathione S-transferase N-terminal domain-containing protein [Oligoflexus sp.]HYX36585.1 glutathione S-transferase N-terminal domain-containing protein [Oligoflexus sp.]